MNFGLPAVNILDELGSFNNTDIRVGRLTDGSNCLPHGHIIGEVTSARMIRTSSDENHSSKTDFKTRRENQDFAQNISMSQPPLNSTHFGTNTSNRTTSPIDSITVGEKIPDPMPLTQPMDSPTLPTDSSEIKGKVHLLS